MAVDLLKLRVVTPAGVVAEAEVREVYLPSLDGEIGILPNHQMYSGLVGAGTLRYLSLTGERVQLMVDGGFCNVLDNTVTILADSAGK